MIVGSKKIWTCPGQEEPLGIRQEDWIQFSRQWGAVKRLPSRGLVWSELVARVLIDGVDRLEAHPLGPWEAPM